MITNKCGLYIYGCCHINNTDSLRKLDANNDADDRILCMAGEPGEMVTETINLGISLLRGGNTDVQKVSQHLILPQDFLKVLIPTRNYICILLQINLHAIFHRDIKYAHFMKACCGSANIS